MTKIGETTPADSSRPRAPTSKLVLALTQIFVGYLILVAIICLLDPWSMRNRAPARRTEALNNIRQIGLGLTEFEEKYGSLPSAAAIPRVREDSSTPLRLDDSSSNRLFRQLLVTGFHSEKPFWAATKISPKQPDDRFDQDANALAPGECAFAYITGISPEDDPATPIVIAPLLPGKTIFDREPFANKAVVLFLDNSTTTLPLDESGRAILNGMDIFDPRQPFWNGKAPDIKWPESK